MPLGKDDEGLQPLGANESIGQINSYFADRVDEYEMGIVRDIANVTSHAKPKI